MPIYYVIGSASAEALTKACQWKTQSYVIECIIKVHLFASYLYLIIRTLIHIHYLYDCELGIEAHKSRFHFDTFTIWYHDIHTQHIQYIHISYCIPILKCANAMGPIIKCSTISIPSRKEKTKTKDNLIESLWILFVSPNHFSTIDLGSRVFCTFYGNYAVCHRLIEFNFRLWQRTKGYIVGQRVDSGWDCVE